MNWLIVLTVFLFVCAAAWMHFRRRPVDVQNPPAPTVIRTVAPPGPRRQERRHYYGAALKTGDRPCSAALAAEGNRCLMEDAPELPMPGCDAGVCHCRILPLDDRRADYDRRDRFTAYGDFDADMNQETRAGEDRRQH